MKLAQYFSDRDNYDFPRISEGCRGDEDQRSIVGTSVELLRNNLATFRKALTDCSILPGNSSVTEEIELGDSALRELQKYFCGDSSSTLGSPSFGEVSSERMWPPTGGRSHRLVAP